MFESHEPSREGAKITLNAETLRVPQDLSSIEDFKKLWENNFVRSRYSKTNPLIIEVYGNLIWEKYVRPFLQKSLIPGDKELIRIKLITETGNKRGEKWVRP